MPVPIIAAAVVGASAIGAAAISSSAQKKAADNAADLAREQQATALEEQQRLEEKYGLTTGELQREQRLLGVPQGEEAINMAIPGLEETRQSELERRAGMSGEELLKEVGPDTRQLLDNIASRQGMTGEELFRTEGAIPQALADQVLAEVKAPEQFYEDTLAPQLELARQMVNAEANRRGVFGGLPEGGIRFEQLGRTGVDLAIKSAEAKLAQRQQALSNASVLATYFPQLSAAARGEQATVSERGLTEKQQARTELSDFLQLMENASASSKGRAAQVGLGASQSAQNATNQAYSNLIGIEGYKGNIISPAEAGLTTIGSIATDYMGLPTTKKETVSSTGVDTSSLGYLREAGTKYDPFEELGGITGSQQIALKKKYPNLISY